MIRIVARKSSVLSAAAAGRGFPRICALSTMALSASDLFFLAVHPSKVVVQQTTTTTSRMPTCIHQTRWMTTTTTTTTTPTDNEKNEKMEQQEQEETPSALVYESPLAAVVHKLRTVSLMTGIIGSVGVPCMIAIKGTMPDSGLLLMAMAFVSGTIGSTAAIHYVFSPYVYRIESIPVRKCSYKMNDGSEKDLSSSSSLSSCKPKKEVLLKAVTRSLFLRQVDVVFDPETDVTPYRGMQPLCNFQAKGIPLYVHTEYLYDEKMRKVMNLDDTAKAPIQKDNPDDLL